MSDKLRPRDCGKIFAWLGTDRSIEAGALLLETKSGKQLVNTEVHVEPFMRGEETTPLEKLALASAVSY